MRCPGCNTNLAPSQYHGIIVDTCPECQGLWLNRNDLRAYVEFLLKDDARIPDARLELHRSIVGAKLLSKAARRCPSCDQPMEQINYGYDSNVILDRCSACNGLWIDGGEISQLATYIKGNPTLVALGKDLLEEQKITAEMKEWKQLAENLSKKNVAWWIFMPKMVLPLRAEQETGIFPIAVLGLVLVNVIIFLCQAFYVENLQEYFRQYGLIPANILSGNGYPSLLSSMFVHSGLLHVAGNMFFLWLFGNNVEGAFGHWRFLALYLVVGLFGSLLEIVTAPQSNVPAVGASGAISGIMGAFFVLYPKARIKTLIIIHIVDVPAFLYLGVWILFQIVYGVLSLSTQLHPEIGWFAHIGGFLSGAAMAWLLKGPSQKAIT